MPLENLMRKSFTLALAVAALTLGSLAARADNLQDGAKAFQGGQYSRALTLWRPLATQGNPVAQNNLGIMYLDGKGVPRDFARAMQWFSASASQGNSAGMYNMGLMYELGQGIKPDPFRAYMWYALAADQGNMPNAVAHRNALWSRMTPAAQNQARELSVACKRNNYKGCA